MTCNCNKQPIKINCTFTGDTLPSYTKDGDSGMDLHALTFREVSKGELLPVQEFGEDGYILRPHDRILVQTGLKIEFPEGIEAELRPRSGLSLKHGIMAILGTVDSHYRGDNGIILLNTSNEEYVIHKGDRLGQLVFQRPVKVELQVKDSISQTLRGETGFGSSGR